VYVANIDKKVEREDVRNFFEQLCGELTLPAAGQHSNTGKQGHMLGLC
jgi:hypothetical protein